jgi:hypothetical protein
MDNEFHGALVDASNLFIYHTLLYLRMFSESYHSMFSICLEPR